MSEHEHIWICEDSAGIKQISTRPLHADDVEYILASEYAALKQELADCEDALGMARIHIQEFLDYDNAVIAMLKRRIAALRNSVDELVNDGEVHEMGGPFIDGNWVLKQIDALLETK